MEDKEFEVEVLRIARELWPSASADGSELMDGRERDGVFFTDETIHIVECTTSRRKAKAKQDIDKSVRLAPKLAKKHPHLAVKCWFVTLEEPTADQRAVAQPHRPMVTCVSYDRFRARIVDASAYLRLRDDYAFGSVRDPAADPASAGQKYEGEYVPMTMLENGVGGEVSLEDALQELDSGGSVCILGDYGAGKSMTLRELYQDLRSRYFANRSMVFPVLLNLRDHQGQKSPVEALERHARSIGFGRPAHLVRAWRSGFIVLLLDGFDELATFGWADRTGNLRRIRYEAMELVRRFQKETPANCGVAISGRVHYFDSARERREALGMPRSGRVFSLSDFNDEQIALYLSREGLEQEVPDWLPTRPLLLGYLARKGDLGEVSGSAGTMTPGEGWDYLLDRIASREAQIEAGIPGGTVRELMERLATRVRKFNNRVGPLYRDDLVSAFKATCGYAPDDRGMVLLQRLPGLGVADGQDGARMFIDEDLADAAKVGDVVRFAMDPWNFRFEVEPSEWPDAIGEVGQDLLSLKLTGLPAGAVSAAARVGVRNGWNALVADLVLSFQHREEGWTEGQIQVEDAHIPTLDLGDRGNLLRDVEFVACTFNSLSLGSDADGVGELHFKDCLIGQLIGGHSDSPAVQNLESSGCIIEEYDDRGRTTSGLLELDIPLSVRVAQTVLKKLYLQPGKGRIESAFFRGLDHREKRYVAPVLQVLESSGLAVSGTASGRRIWRPVRGKHPYARRAVGRVDFSRDPVMRAVEDIGEL